MPDGVDSWLPAAAEDSPSAPDDSLAACSTAFLLLFLCFERSFLDVFGLSRARRSIETRLLDAEVIADGFNRSCTTARLGWPT